MICVKKERLMRNSYGHYQKKAESRKSSVGLKVTYLEQPQDVGPDHLKQYFQTKSSEWLLQDLRPFSTNQNALSKLTLKILFIGSGPL